MKKIILIVLSFLTIMPNLVLAKCDYEKHELIKEEAKNITYSIDYNSTNKKFTITFENISEDMYAIYKKTKYTEEDNKIIIKNLSEGTSTKIYFYANDGCENEIDIRMISIPYYNEFYNNSMCKKYNGILTVCTSQFTNNKVTKELVEKTIDNYEHMTIPVVEEEEEEVIVEKTFIEKVKDFTSSWGLKILFVVGSSLITIIIGNSIYRKTLHGV